MKVERYFYMSAITLLVILLLYNWKCRGDCPDIVETTKTTVDSTIHEVKDSAETFKPEPVTVIKNKKRDGFRLLPTDGNVSTTEPLFIISQDSADIISDYYDTKQYSNTYEFEYGSVQVKNSISENKIQYQQVIPTWKIPEKTTTIIKTVTATKEVEKKRTQLYFGVDLLGNKETPLNGLDVSFSLKTKNDWMIDAGALKLNHIPLHFKAGVKIKIHF